MFFLRQSAPAVHPEPSCAQSGFWGPTAALLTAASPRGSCLCALGGPLSPLPCPVPVDRGSPTPKQGCSLGLGCVAPVCSLTSLLWAWHVPSLLWASDSLGPLAARVSALPSWHLGLLPLSGWLSGWDATAGDQFLRKWPCYLLLRPQGARAPRARKPWALGWLGGHVVTPAGTSWGLHWECRGETLWGAQGVIGKW